MADRGGRRRDGKASGPAAGGGSGRGKRLRREKAEEADRARLRKRSRQYARGTPLEGTKKVPDKKLKGRLSKTERAARAAAYQAARAEILLPEQAGYLEAEGMERTYKFTQAELSKHIDQQSARKMLELKLEVYGPYQTRFTSNGRHMLLGGRRGHVAAFDWQSGALACELHLQETVRDITWLHNEGMFAVAQKRFVYLYDNTGAEMHVLRKHIDPMRVSFLRHHFLLVSVGNAGYLSYQDTSTGQLVCTHRTRMGRCVVMQHNPHNAIVHLGHTNGTVTLWSPNMTTPLVKQLCHRGPLQAVALDQGGLYMATSGQDGQVKIWDIRNFKDEPLQQYGSPRPAQSLDISQQGLLAVGHGAHVQVWKDAFRSHQRSPYMHHLLPGSTVESCRFVPFEDVLSLGHSSGVSHMVVPGAGEPNFDAFEANPYQTNKQRQEAEVKSLLEKIPATMISRDPSTVLRVDRAAPSIKALERQEQEALKETGEVKEKFKKRGRSSAKRRFLKKKTNIIDAKRVEMTAKFLADKERRQRDKSGEPEKPKTALDRFGR